MRAPEHELLLASQNHLVLRGPPGESGCVCEIGSEPPGTRTRNQLITRPSHVAFYASRNGSLGGVLNSFFGFGLLATRHLRRPDSVKFATLGVKWVSNW